MSNNTFPEREEKMFDAILKVAASESLAKQLDSLPSKEELESMNLCSNDFNKRMIGIISRAENAQKRKRMAKWTYKAAAIFGLIFTVSTITLMSVEASRVFILNTFFAVTHDDHVVFGFGEVTQQPEIEVVYGIAMPSNFNLINAQRMANISIFVFSNDLGEIVTIQQSIGVGLGAFVDNEQRKFITLNIRGQEVHLFEATDNEYHNVAVWSSGNDVLQVIVQFEAERLLLLVETIIENTP